jgi:hypothetical protein
MQPAMSTTESTANARGSQSKALVMMSLGGAATGALFGAWSVYDFFAHRALLGQSYWLQQIVIYGAAGALTGAFIVVARRTSSRFRQFGKESLPCRSILLLILSAITCVCGFVVTLFGWNQISDLASWNPFEKSASNLPIGTLAMTAGLVMCAAGAVSLCFLDKPTQFTNRSTIVLTCISLGLLTIWPVISSTKFSDEASRSHSAGAGFGAALVIFVIPSLISVLLITLLGIMVLCRRLAPGASISTLR